MSEEELNSVQDEVATQDSNQDEIQHHEPVDQAQTQYEDKQDRNWREMRRKQKELEEELKRKDDLFHQMMQAQLASQNKTTPIVEEEDDPDEIAPVGKVKGIAKKAVQPLEQKIADLEARLAKQDQDRLFQSLRSKYPDFDAIVNVETLELLEQREPELAATIGEFKDPYKMGMQSYKYIKALNLIDELPNTHRSKELSKKIEQSKKTVQSPLVNQKRPIAQAYRNSEVDSTKLYEEMMYYAKQAGGSL